MPPNQPELFLGLSNTAWTAISSIATFLAVLVALYLPLSERFNRRRKIYKSIENEIRNNFRVLEKIKNQSFATAVTKLIGETPQFVVIAHVTRQIDVEYWEHNKQLISESSFKKLGEYTAINKELKELKLFGEEVLQPSRSSNHADLFLIGFESTYTKMKKFEKYW